MNPPARGIIAWFACNPVAANILMIVIMVSGFFSAMHIRKEFFPELTTGTIDVNIPLPGAAPADVEQGVVLKVEEALQGLSGIKKISAMAYEGHAAIQVEVLNDDETESVRNQIETKIDSITTFPDEVKTPVITKQTTRSGVLWLVLSGPLSEKALKALAQQIKDELIVHKDISQVEIEGTRENEILIELSETAMSKYGLTFDTVAEAVRRHSLDMPAGKMETTSGDLLLRINAQADSAAGFKNIPVKANHEGTGVTLGQVARVEDGFKDENWFLRFQGQTAVGLQVFRVGNQNALDVAAAVGTYVAQKQAELPQGVQLTTIADTSVPLKDRLNLMLKNIGWGGLLVFMSLILFLRMRVAIWVMAGLPVCFLGTLWLMPAPLINISINMVTLFGFFLVLGIIVDDAIVIGENIHTTIQRKGPGVDNVIFGARQVATAATFGVLTTMAAFVPMLMIPGMEGKIWRGIALVIILSLAFSLIESKLILPAHLAHMTSDPLSGKKKGLLGRAQSWIKRVLNALTQRVYQPLLERSLKNCVTTLAIFTAVLIITAGMVTSGKIRFVFSPDIENDTIEANLRLAAGAPMDVKLSACRQVENAVHRLNDQLKAETGLTDNVIRNVISLTIPPDRIWFYAELLPPENRPMGSNDISNRWRQAVGDINGAISLEFQSSAADYGKPINFELRGNDFKELRAAANELKQQLSSYQGVQDIQDSFVNGKKELRLGLKPAAAYFGISDSDLARQIRQGFFGSEIQTLQRGRNEVKVNIRYPKAAAKGTASLKNVHLRTAEGGQIPFHAVADTRVVQGYASIHRINRHRVVNVLANVNKSTIDPQRIIADVQTGFMPKLLDKYPGMQYRLSGEASENQSSMEHLKRGAVLAFMLIFAMMAIPLKSYVQPLVIMAAIPFGVVGAIWGHFFIGLPVSILSICGIIALSGVVVNDSLVMVDVINQKRASGHPLIHAVKASGVARLRAILLTSITTFIGLLPMLLERSLQAQFLIPMSVSLAFGILFATAITLILVPVLYVSGAMLKNRLWKMIGTNHLRVEVNRNAQ